MENRLRQKKLPSGQDLTVLTEWIEAMWVGFGLLMFM